ncbi:SepM family pheromone-processing serine protease [Agrilactobacillus yilanensis]|uniref:endopeptidase La n=1 Tax=Agrilactobacillus yilanensis TaxID=2485997 RepID=A0ABW4J7J5_9LACO|nr:SepM family pheromone-processing serine protease [Agrilactobacillus yilanensis]
MAQTQPHFYQKRWFNRFVWIIGTLFLAWLVLFPTNYFLEKPGTAEQVSKFVTVKGHEDKTKGKFLLTTVRVQQATPIQLVIGHFQPFTETLSREALMGSASSAAYDKLQDYYIENSENMAIAQAAKKAKVTYQQKFIGVYVLDVIKKSDFYKHLQLGDTVNAVNQRQFESTTDFQKYIRQHKVGDKVTVTYQRDKKTKQATGKLITLPGTKKAGLGITLTDHTKVTTKIPIKIDAADIGGPSAGLMFTLQVYDQLTGHHLRQGRTIAGTGTIENDGTVGAIGGIDKKVVAASEAGATVFFAPDDQLTKAEKKQLPNYQNNYQIAKKAAKKIQTKMKIVPVKSLDDAINYLKKSNS